VRALTDKINRMRELNYIDETIEKNENPELRIGSVGRSALSTVYLMDCIEGMKQFPDKIFDFAVVDPPYGLGNRLSDGGGKLKNTPMAELYRNKEWDILPSAEYWQELFRVSKNQIVFGANYFFEYLPNTRGFVCWDKKQSMPTLSACELVWTSLDKPAKIMRYSSMDLKRFHPTQKPEEVYDFMFDFCRVEKGNLILDTHLGSQSSRIAANKAGLDFVGFEIDREYYDKGNKRFKNFVSQGVLF
jgi:site-specific DNA-methyltransferase (adenine-specific)